MTEIETSRNVVNGNTKHSQPKQLVKWCFTFNNYEECEISEIETRFKEICNKYVFQKEIGECGTPHLQGAIWLKKKMRFTEFKLSKKIHWEAMRNEEASIKYCQKSDTSVGNPFIFGFPKPIKVIDKLYEWQLDIEKLYFTEPDGRSVYWYYDLIGGKGKSSFCKYMFVKYGVITIQGGKLGDIMNIIFNLNMDNVKMLIIDVPRNNGNKVSYSSIECILNGMITNTKYETGIKAFNPPHVVVFSNEEPDESKLSLDRWKIKNII